MGQCVDFCNQNMGNINLVNFDNRAQGINQQEINAGINYIDNDSQRIKSPSQVESAIIN